MGYKVAVVGATGNVGREMLNILDERKFPADEVVVLDITATLDTLFGEIDRQLKLPEHFGHNWDALADVLGSSRSGLSEAGAR